MEKMNSFYEEKANTYRMLNPKLNDYCVVVEKNRFYRAQIRRLINEVGSLVECFLLDEGRTNTYERKDFFKIDEKFLNFKFQVRIGYLKSYLFKKLTIFAVVVS